MVLLCVVLALMSLMSSWFVYAVYAAVLPFLLLISFLIHELHFVILDADVITNIGFIALESEASGFRASALSGPLVPFAIGLALWHLDWIPAIPFLFHVLSLPFDILGALGVCLGLC